MAKKKRNELPVPKIEALLKEAYLSYNDLQTLRNRISSHGISMDALPGDIELQAFSLLGNHQRMELSNRIAPHLSILAGKGLIDEAKAESMTSPVLRFYCHIAPLLDDLLDISQRFMAGIEALDAGGSATGGPVIRCALRADGLLGQEMRVRVHIFGGQWLWVRPDPVFGLAETLLPISVDCAPVEFRVPCDQGSILIAGMTSLGDVSIHRLHLTIMQEAKI
jgi:hypothetical protein